MKPELQKIEAALGQIENQRAAAKRQELPTSNRTFHSLQLAARLSSACDRPSNSLSSNSLSYPQSFISSPPTSCKSSPRVPTLPYFPSSPPPNSNEQTLQPLPAMQKLREIEATLISWQDELLQVLEQIDRLYREGPIVNGWLEVVPFQDLTDMKQNGEVAKLRYIDTDSLMEYVDKICRSTRVESTCQIADANYHLCGLDEDGHLWSQPCPSEQLQSVSLAITRYHKLRQLMDYKQQIETHLAELATALASVQEDFKASQSY